MRKKSTLKRMLAGILAMSTALSAVPMQMATTVLAAEDYTSESNAEYMYELLNYLSELGDDYGLPPIMISEGDKVFIDGQEVATTVVPINKDLVNKQNKIRSEYWLDVLKAGTYDELKADSEALKAYFDSNMIEYNNYDKAMRETLIKLRDYCIENGLTKDAIWEDTTLLGTGNGSLISQLTSITSNYTSSSGYEYYKDSNGEIKGQTVWTGNGGIDPYADAYYEQAPSRLYIDVDSTLNLVKEPSATFTTSYDSDTELEYIYANAKYRSGMVDLNFGLTNHFSDVNEELYGVASSLGTLIGDSTVDSATYIDEQLKIMSPEDMLYAYAAVYTNLYRINQQLDTSLYNIYVPKINATVSSNMLQYSNWKDSVRQTVTIQPLHEVETITIPTSTTQNTGYNSSYYDKYYDKTQSGLQINYDTPIVVCEYRGTTPESYNKILEVETLLHDTLNGIATNYDDLLNGLYAYISDEYTFTGLGTTDVTYTTTGNISAKADKAESIIANIPEDLQEAWSLLYDTRLGIDAIDTPFEATTAEDYYARKQNVLDGNWDYSSTVYDANKYISVPQTIDGVEVIVKQPILDAAGNEKLYGKQNEVTPWISMDSVYSDSEYLKNVYADLIRNNIDAEYEAYNPIHPLEYNSTNSEDLVAILQENGYTETAAKDTTFKLQSMRIQVDRYAIDAEGRDYTGLVDETLDVTDNRTFKYLDMLWIYERIKDVEYGLIDETLVDNFMSFLAYVGANNEGWAAALANEEYVAALKDAYLRDMSGFNTHNGYAITLTFNYDTKNPIVVEVADPGKYEKLLLAEIPEYSISEYYEDKTDLFTVDELVSDIFDKDTALKAQLEMFKANPDKILSEKDEFAFAVQTDTTVSWENYLTNFVQNKTLNTISGVYTVPVGTTLRLPAYVPVSGRTFDTRYFIKYIPYNTTVLPDVSDWRYYATAFTSKMPLNSLGAFANVSGESANGFAALDIAADKTNKLTVMYAQDRGATMYRAMQRLLSPVQQFTVVGNETYNMNTHLTVNEIVSGLTGYTTNGMALAVADIGLPELVWDANAGTIYNQKTNGQTYGGDIHLWLSKETEKDGILIADWVNPVPTSLQDALQATNTTTGTYQNGENITSTEMPSRVSSGENIVVIDQGTTEGTYATWAFERKLVKSEGLSYCAKCNKVVLESAHKTLHATTYQTVGKWELYGSELSTSAFSDLKDYAESVNGQNSGPHKDPEEYVATKVQDQASFGDEDMSYSDWLEYGGVQFKRKEDYALTTTDEPVDGKLEVVGTSQAECRMLLISLILNGTVTADNCERVDFTFPGWETPANPNGADEMWLQKYGNLEGLLNSLTVKPNPPPPPPPTWHYSERTVVLPKDIPLCNGTMYPVTVWTLGGYGKSDYVGSEEMTTNAIVSFNETTETTTETTGTDAGTTVTTTTVKTTTPAVEKSDLMIDFYYSSIPETRNILGNGVYTYESKSGATTQAQALISGGVTEGTYQLGVSGTLPLGASKDYRLQVYLQPDREATPSSGGNSVTIPSDLYKYSNKETDFIRACTASSAASSLSPEFGSYNSILSTLNTLKSQFSCIQPESAEEWKEIALLKGNIPVDAKNALTLAKTYVQGAGYKNNIKSMSVPTINPKTWGVVAAESVGAAVVPLYDLDYVYNLAVKGSLVEEKSYAALIARSLKDNKSPKVLNDTSYLVRYVDSIFDLVADDSDASAAPNLDNIDSKMSGTPESVVKTFYKVAGDVKTGNLNAMIIPLNDTKEEYTLLDTGSTEGETTGTRKVTVVTPKLTYIPYTVINNIEGVTRDGDELEFDYTEKTEIVTEDILGKELIHEYRSETQDSVFPANIVPEVLMTFKEHFLTPEGDLKEYEDRGKVDSVYIAAYNEYSMELPSFSRTSLHSDIGPDDFTVTGAMVAVTQAAKALSNSFDVLYTGSDVNVMIESDEAPEVEFHSYIIDFADANVGEAWNAGYTENTADQQAQLYVDRYKNDAGKFEYNATLSNTFDNSTLYSDSSNAETSTKSSTITVDGRTMEPLTISETYEFDIINSKGETNKTEQIAEYPIEIRNGRVASITVDGVNYNLYGNGEITTTEQLVASAGFAALKAANYELAEAVVHLELPEFASTLVHNGGSQTWQSYKGTGIYEDNTGKSVFEEVDEIKGTYDVNFDGTDGWYGEDVTTLVIKEYKLQGEIEDDYAFSYKVPIDYGYKSPRNKSDFFKAGTALYAYNELYFEFLNKVEITEGVHAGESSGTFDVVGDEGTGICVQTPEIGYVISNATVDDMYAR